MKNLTKTHLSFPDWAMRETATLAPFKYVAPFVVLCLLTLVQCSELSDYENQQVAEALNDSLFSVTESWDIEMEMLEEGDLKLLLTGSYARNIKNDQRNITHIKGPVYIEIFNEQGQPDTFVNADSAVYRPDDTQFELFGSVHVVAPENKELYSDYLKWEREADRVSTPDFVIFITDTDSIAGTGFYGNTNLTNYTLNEGGGRAVID